MATKTKTRTTGQTSIDAEQWTDEEIASHVRRIFLRAGT